MTRHKGIDWSVFLCLPALLFDSFSQKSWSHIYHNDKSQQLLHVKSRSYILSVLLLTTSSAVFFFLCTAEHVFQFNSTVENRFNVEWEHSDELMFTWSLFIWKWLKTNDTFDCMRGKNILCVSFFFLLKSWVYFI